MKKNAIVILFVLLLSTPAFSETYLCVEDKKTITGKIQENFVFKRTSKKYFEMTLIGREEKLPLNIYFEDYEVITLLLPEDLTKFLLTMISINKVNNTYTAISHDLTRQITENIDIFEVLDTGKCQLLQ